MKFVVGIKDKMTQVFDANGVCHPATILRVESATITKMKTVAVDGYDAVQLASGTQKSHRIAKAQQGQFGGAAIVREFRPKSSYGETVPADMAVGTTIDAGMFAPGDIVTVSSVSKGKGFQGVVKRHGFAGGRRTHGQKHSEREPGSIGSTGFGRVIKGLRMAGRMGGDRITVKNLTILQVNPAENLLLVKGAIPGRPGTLVEVRASAK